MVFFPAPGAAAKIAVSALFLFLLLPGVFAKGAGERERHDPPEQKNEALAEAVNSRDISRIRDLLDAGADPDYRTGKKHIPLLSLAVDWNNAETVQLLLEHGADPEQRDDDGKTAVHYAADKQGNTAFINLKTLAEKGARLDVLDHKGKTPLAYAMDEPDKFRFILAWEKEHVPGFSGSEESRADYLVSLISGGFFMQIIPDLLDAGMPIESRDRSGTTAAWHAAAYSDSQNDPFQKGGHLLRLLMERGARFDVVNNQGRSPLEASMRYGAKPGVSEAVLEWEEEHSPAFCGSKKSRGEYLGALVLQLCFSRDGYGDMVERLLSAGADLSPFITAEGVDASFYYYSNYLILLSRGLPVNVRDREGKTLLIRAAWNTDAAAVQALLAAGADPDIQDKSGETALMEACRRNRAGHGETNSGTTVIRLLLDAGADASIKNSAGETALHFAYSAEREIIVRLEEAGAGINDANDEGYTPLMRAVQNGDAVHIEKLAGLGADPLAVLPNGTNLLLFYLQTNRNWSPAVVEFLINCGIDPAAKNRFGDSALLEVRRKRETTEESRIILAMLSGAADKKTASQIKFQAGREKRKEFFEDAPITPLLLSLSYMGLSIGMREGTFRDDPRSNWMAPVNTFVTMFAAGGTAGFLTLFTLTGGWSSSGWNSLGTGLLSLSGGVLIGFISGIACAAIPAVRNVFAENRFLYYLPSAGMAAAAIVSVRWIFH